MTESIAGYATTDFLYNSKKAINSVPQFTHLQNRDDISLMKGSVARLHSFVFSKYLVNLAWKMSCNSKVVLFLPCEHSNRLKEGFFVLYTVTHHSLPTKASSKEE